MSTDIEQIQLYARTRDAGAFAALMAAYSDMVYATCLRILANRSEAEDATQECFWRLARESAGIRTSVGAWLHRCATNECITRKRRKSAKAQRELAYETTRQAQRAEASAWSEVSPAVDEALEELPEELRAILIGHFLQRRTQAELAEDMGVSPATMSRRIAEGVELIRKRLKSRGVMATAALLTLFLAERTTSAATPTVVAGLGKMALAGPPAQVLRWTMRAKVAIAGAAVVAAGGLAWGGEMYAHRQAANPAAAVAKVDAGTSMTEPQTPAQVYPLLARIRYGLPQVSGDDPIAAARELSQIGATAVPAIAEELDRSQREDEQRLLLFTLRIIHDRAAVPALLRALPRLSTGASPYVVELTDPALRQFVRAHTAPGVIGFAAPAAGLQPALVECVAALETITGQPAVYAPAPGRAGPPVRDPWIAWYTSHRTSGLPELALTAPALGKDRVAAAGQAQLAALFPTGQRVAVSPIREILLDARDGWDAEAYLDLDSGERLQRNQGWTDHGNHPDADWIREAGVDLAVQSDDGTIRLRSEGLTAWPVDDVRLQTLPAEVHLNEALDVGSSGPIVLHEALDERPRTFLFTTREGGRGILQVALADTADGKANVRIQYRLFSGGTVLPPPLADKLQAAPAPTAQFGAEREVVLATSVTGRSMALDLDTGALRADAADAEIAALTTAKARWLREWGGDVILLPASQGDRSTATLAGDHFIAIPVTPDAWTSMTAADAATILQRRDGSVDSTEALLRIAPGHVSTWVFQTREGCAGLMQADGASGGLHLRYKVLR